MSTNPGKDDFLDDEPTDELPILLETVVLDPAEHAVDIGDDEPTGRHAALGASAETPAPTGDVETAARASEELAGARAELERLTRHVADLERGAAERDATIDELRTQLDQSGEQLAERELAERRFTAELRDREAQFSGLLDELDRLRAQVEARDAKLEELGKARDRADAELAAARQALAAAAEPAPPPEEPDSVTRQLREELAALTHYIANRRAWWDGLEAEAREQRRRIAELEREVEQRAARERRAEDIADRENAKATELKAALLASATALEDRDRLLATTPPAAPPSAPEERCEVATEEPARELDAEPDTADGRDESREIVAELEAALEQRRAELDSRDADMAEREQRLAAAESESQALRAELDVARKTLAEMRSELERERRDKERLESLIDERDHRLESLERDLGHKLESLERLNTARPIPARRAEPRQPAAAHARSPTLVCLTSDAPRNYPLTKKTVTIGRSSQCEIQIHTQFVSRQHARITVRPDGVVIEDLGSTNGVFVNSVRVERQELVHGDLVTVGESQFRFMETVAH